MNEVRQWQRSDLSAIQQIAWETWADAYGAFVPEVDRRVFHDSYYDLLKLKNLFDSGIVHGCVALVDEFTVGFSKTFWDESESKFFITSLYVLPQYQKLSLGKRMLEYGVNIARSSYNLDRVWLGVMVENKPAIDWYLRQGFIFEESKPFTLGNTTIEHLYGYLLI